jgi:hypothetical protein
MNVNMQYTHDAVFDQEDYDDFLARAPAHPDQDNMMEINSVGPAGPADMEVDDLDAVSTAIVPSARIPRSDPNGASGAIPRPAAGRPLITRSADTEQAGGYPRLMDAAHGDQSGSESDDEPESKRPRIDDEYEIASALSEVPRNYMEAMASVNADKWKEDVCMEIKSHVRNRTWDLVYRPTGVKVVGHKWVFAHKFGENGEIARYKARLVALGFLQMHGVDYMEMYSPVASTNTIRVFLSVCCQRQLHVRQFDIETAFLNGDLDETVYMSPPQSVDIPDRMVCRLRRSIKQAANVCSRIRSVLSSMGFTQCRSDPCLFIRHDPDDDRAAPMLIAVTR